MTATIDQRLATGALSIEVVRARQSVVERYLEALNAADLDAVCSVFAPDAVVIDPIGTEPIHGVEDIRAFFQGGPFLHPINAELQGEVCVAGNAAAFAFFAKSDGKAMHIIDVFEFDEAGLVCKMIAYWSSANVTPAAAE